MKLIKLTNNMTIPKLFFPIFTAMVMLIGWPNQSRADDALAPVNINLEVEGPTSTLFNQNVTVPACVTPNNATSTVNGFCAFAAAGLPADVTWSSFGGLVNSINGISGDSNNYWLWFLNGEPASVGIDSYNLQIGDKILWALGRQPLKVSFSTLSPRVNATSTIKVLGFNPANYDFEPVSGAMINGGGVTTDANGTAEIVATSTRPFAVSVSADGFIPSPEFTIAPKPESVNLVIRNASSTVFSGNVDLPDDLAPDLMIVPDNGASSTIAISPKSVLGVLETLQASSTTFKITKLSYFSSLNSFLINCVAAPADSAAPDCDNWTYAVNGSYPALAVDRTILKNNDTVYLFFGSRHKVSLSAGSALAGQPFTATAWQYDLSSGDYVPLSGVTLGAGNFNPDFSFNEIATSAVDSMGQATFTISATGTMAVGVKEDFYFPYVSINITDTASAPPAQAGGGGGGGAGASHLNFNLPDALAFVSGRQNADGSFASPIVTDWAALAFASADPGAAKTKLYNYLQTARPEFLSVTDYERHAMALLSLNINPYSGSPTDCISPIVKAFDGAQIGDVSLDTDDIFAIFPLTHSGFGPADPIIQKEISYIISRQLPDGSWDESADVTAAAISAIGPFFASPGYVKAMGNAIAFLAAAQKADGGFGNIDSTSWVQTMLTAVKEGDPAHFVPLASSAGLLPTDFMAASQQPDGGVLSPDRVWSTAYAITAASGKSWLSILHSFPLPDAAALTSGGTASNNSGSVLGESTSTAADLTISTATTTPQSTASGSPVALKPPLTVSPPPALTAAPKPRALSLAAKTKALPFVAPEQISAPPAAAPPPPALAEQPPSPKKLGWLSLLWQAITAFFKSLF